MAKTCPVAPARPLDPFYKTIGENCLGDKTLRALQQDTDFPNTEFPAQQSLLTGRFDPCRIRDQHDHWIASPYLQLITFCGWLSLGKWIPTAKITRSRFRFSPESDTNISTWIKKQAEKSVVIIRTDIKNYRRKVRKFEASARLVDFLILRHSAELEPKRKFRTRGAALASSTSLSG
jgi:hypothetical protein